MIPSEGCPFQTWICETMSPRTFLVLHVAATVVGTAAFWWFVMPAHPQEALADGISASAIAGFAEIMVIRAGW